MQCSNCSGTEFKEAIQYMKVKEVGKGKMAINGSEVVLTFCVNCGTVSNIRLTNPSMN
ncbi:hypothetical protein [Saccharibacillus qingshengii]|uniref:hypothetical protein n=1 Tax=Saccharibacillus qingshengii TaxID=1763540 RepID=UPI0015579CFC|nr:hypothetical protein [Saccharibacillus qingshengii]